jgi:type IX secretion system PorP/SprF family membrane protein
MKKLFSIIVLLLAGQLIFAQQLRQYTNYIYNQFGHNPAVAGTKECSDVKLGHRIQWVGFEGAPTTSFVSFHTRIKKKYIGGGYHGIGLYIERDNFGPFSNTYILPAYAYHIPLNFKYTLSAGAFLGIQQRVFESNLRLFNPNDNAIGGTRSIFVLPDLSTGVWLHSKKLYAGLAANQVITRRMRGLGGQIGEESRLARHYNLTAGYKIICTPVVSLIPSTMVKFLPMAPPAIDLNLLMDLKNTVSFGLSYRNRDAVAVLARFRLIPLLDMGYSFDLTTSQLKGGSRNTHEFWIGLNLCKRSYLERNSGACPAYN